MKRYIWSGLQAEKTRKSAPTLEFAFLFCRRPLEYLTTLGCVVIFSNMKAVQLVQTRIVYSATAFAELVLWRVPKPSGGSIHAFKYRLAYVVDGVCVLRYDNELGKGDHRHEGASEQPYPFTTPDQLLADFQMDIARWNDENRHS
ncbi:MAG: DUF6516 family protein [Burkholderiales bacterium]|nr:DUF6516 family protein [Burkholderiales bacterium]